MRASVRALYVLFLLTSLAAVNAETAGQKDFVLRDDILRMCVELFRRAGFGSNNYEFAAFVIRDESGRYSSQPFPPLRQFRQAEARGPTPEGAVAIIHTHPSGMERPSRQDQLEAKRLGIPIYVLTRWAIQKVDPNTGNNVRVIQARDWWNIPERLPAPLPDGVLASRVDLPSRVMLRELAAPAGERP